MRLYNSLVMVLGLFLGANICWLVYQLGEEPAKQPFDDQAQRTFKTLALPELTDNQEVVLPELFSLDLFRNSPSQLEPFDSISIYRQETNRAVLLDNVQRSSLIQSSSQPWVWIEPLGDTHSHYYVQLELTPSGSLHRLIVAIASGFITVLLIWGICFIFRKRQL